MEQALATCGSAFVIFDAERSRWSMGNDAICKTVEWRDGVGLVLAGLENRTSGYHWRPALQANELAGGEFSLCWNDTPLSARQATALLGVHTQADAASVTLGISLRVADALNVSVFYRIRPGLAVIEQWLELTPLQTGEVSHVAPLTMSVAALAPPVLHWARGLQGHGAGMPATGPYPAFRICHEPLGQVRLESGLRSTWQEIAWFALDDNTGGDGLFVGLLYSGRWSAHGQAVDSAVTLNVFSDSYATPLTAGQHWRSPGAFFGVYRGGLDDAAHVQHAYLRAALLPSTPDNFPWVQYNTWFAHLVDLDEEILRREALLAAQLGAEVFVIDAGWWAPSLRTRDNFTTGLGVWQPSAEKFPSGIPAFADYVRSLGMGFGIWVEPERVDLRQRATWRLDWLARHNDAIISPPWPPDTVSGWLCFGHPAVQTWALDWISRLVRELNADWLKWDSNWWGVCTCANHGHSVSDGEFHQAQGVHNVLSELRQRFPRLIIENCAGGGTRTDFAMLGNTHITWLHDASTPSRRVRFHLAGASYLFPPEVCNTWIVDADDEPLTDPTTARADLDTIARSRMFGAYGVSARLTGWTEDAFGAVQRAIAQYKQVRPLLKTGRFYHLLPQTRLSCPDLALNGQWEAYAIMSKGAEEGVIWLFRAPDAAPAQHVRLAGLHAGRSYTLTDTDTGRTVRALGASLMADGLDVDLSGRTSALCRVQFENRGFAANP